MKGGGVLIFANPKYVPVAHVLHNEVTVNNAFNVCVISIGKANCRATIAVVYRAPWANKNNTKNLLYYLSSLAPKSKRFIVVGDFNLPKINWFDSSDTAQDGMSNLLSTVNNEINNMVQNTPSTTFLMDHSTDLTLPKTNTIDTIVSAQQPSNIPNIAVKSLSSSPSISNTTATLSCSPISVHLNNVNIDVTHCSTKSSNKSTKAKKAPKQTVPNPHKIADSASNTEHIAA